MQQKKASRKIAHESKQQINYKTSDGRNSSNVQQDLQERWKLTEETNKS